MDHEYTIRIYDFATKKITGPLNKPDLNNTWMYHQGSLIALPDGNLIAGFREGSIRFFAESKGAQQMILPATSLFPLRPQAILVQAPASSFTPPSISLPNMAFGAVKWKKYFGDIGEEPPLPPKIENILNSPCPFWPEKKVKKTHFLVLVPKTVNGKPFTLNFLQELIQNPKNGHKTHYRDSSKVLEVLGDKPSTSSHWVLMTNNVISNNSNKSYEEKKQQLEEMAQKSGCLYELPTALEATTCILMKHVQTGERFYNDKPHYTYAYCQEKIENDPTPIVVGGFIEEDNTRNWGFALAKWHHEESHGVAGVRKL